MNSDSTNRLIAGAHIIPLSADQARAWLDWLTGNGPPPVETHGIRFSLAHSDSGVTWGVLDDNQWKLGATVDPALCPVPSANSLHELRLIGTTAEVLIWRGDGELQGRILADDSSAFDSLNPLRPMDEGRKLRGIPENPTKDGFKRYVDAGGAQHLAPESFPEDFSVRHYLEQDAATGAVRIAGTRLVPEELS